MKRLFAGAMFLALAACGPEVTGPAPEEIAAESSRLTEYLDAEYEEELQRSPESLTYLGRKEQYDKLDDRTEQGFRNDLDWRRESVTTMKANFDYAKLDEEAKASFDMWALALEDAESIGKYWKQGYIFIRSGPHTEIPNFLINFHTVSEPSDMDAYVARVSLIDDAMDQLVAEAKLAAAAGVHPPAFAYAQSIEEIGKIVAGAPFGRGADSPLFADARGKIKGLQDAGKITAEQAADYQKKVSEALTQQVKPGYNRLTAWLKEDGATVPVEAKGANALPDGEAYYRTMLKIQTTTDMTAEQIHELGLSEVARIQAEMETIKTQVGFDGTLQEFFAYMRTAPQFILPDTDEGRAAYLKLADDYLAGMKAKLPGYFGILPKADLVVKRVEAFREEPGGAQHYNPGSPDGTRPGVFYAHLSDMKAMPTYELESTAYHEGLPGHHMQISIQQELTGLPVFRTQYSYTAYVEGWALYTEDLAKEMGFYTDPYTDYGRLSSEIWRAIRLVVDTGIHSKGWSEEQAVKYFMDNSSSAEGAIRSEIRRYIVWPGQATCYKIGMIRIQQLRDEAKATLGDSFDYKGFHDVVLSGGALPLSVLDARVHRWIEARKAS